ncbi:unnamed protein product, partial [Ixodes persulcatus]
LGAWRPALTRHPHSPGKRSSARWCPALRVLFVMLCFFAISVLESAPWSTSCSIFTFVLRSFGGRLVPRLALTLGIEITSVARPPKTCRTTATSGAQHRPCKRAPHRSSQHSRSPRDRLSLLFGTGD